MLVEQSKLLPLKQKRADTGWIPGKRMCERELVATSRVQRPEIFEYPFFNRMQSESFADIYESDANVVISAPTASGKTALMELAILRNLEKNRGQVLYLAPLKALCQEKKGDWTRRLSRIGLKCVEVTGDSDDSELQSFRKADVILATPEKWDSVSRKGFTPISLLLIDEVHILEQDTRGATLEAVVSRMKLVYSRASAGPLRIVAISATIPNIEDVAAWLGTKVILNYDSSYRPVPLTTKVLGYQKHQNQFKFEQSLNFKLFGVIQRYSNHKSTLVFCQTQKGTVNAAKRLVQDAGTSFISSPQQQATLTQASTRLKDRQLAEVLVSAIGFHNAGLSPEDRSVIEQLFLAGELVVLCTTSTLAIGVNLPCHLVVVKSTVAYRGNAEGYTEYSSLELLQMIGRAGRPQFDTCGTAVIMTELEKLQKYELLMTAQEVIESALAKSMVEHINAEIALSSVTSPQDAIAWLKSTFYYIRAKAAPQHYGLSSNVDMELVAISSELLRKLEGFNLIQRQDDKFTSTSLGRAVSSNCVQVDTVISFTETVHMDTTSEDLLWTIARAREYEGYPSKMDQRRDLNLLNAHPALRFRIKGAVNSYDKKVFLLLQAALSGCLPESWELRQQVASVAIVSRRVVNVLREFCLFHDLGKSLVRTLVWGRQFSVRMWDDDPLVCKLIPGIGDKLARTLSLGGITSFSDLLAADPRKVEFLCGKNAPFGTNVKSFAAGIPRFTPAAEMTPSTVKVSLKNESVLNSEVNSTAFLLLTLPSGSILAYRRINLAEPQCDFSFLFKAESDVQVSVIVSNFVSADASLLLTVDGIVSQEKTIASFFLKEKNKTLAPLEKLREEKEEPEGGEEAEEDSFPGLQIEETEPAVSEQEAAPITDAQEYPGLPERRLEVAQASLETTVSESKGEEGAGPLPASFFMNSQKSRLFSASQAAFLPPKRTDRKVSFGDSVPKIAERVSEASLRPPAIARQLQELKQKQPVFPSFSIQQTPRQSSYIPKEQLLANSISQSPLVSRVQSENSPNGSSPKPQVNAKWQELLAGGAPTALQEVTNVCMQERREVQLASLKRLCYPLSTPRVTAPAFSFDSIFSDI